MLLKFFAAYSVYDRGSSMGGVSGAPILTNFLDVVKGVLENSASEYLGRYLCYAYS